MAYNKENYKEIAQKKLKELDDKIISIFDELVKNIDTKQTSNEIKKILDGQIKFYKYSMRNTVLLLSQAKERNIKISKIASFTAWKSIKNDAGESVQVKKGEKGFKIISPLLKKKEEEDKNTEEEYEIFGYKVSYVFDVSQTNAKELNINFNPYEPHLATTTNISQSIYQKIKNKISDTYKIPIAEEELANDVSGYYQYSNKDEKIVINSNLDNDKKLSTLYHEVGHFLLHKNSKLSTQEKEGEAETYAYMLSTLSNIDIKSEIYIKGWGNDGKDIEEKMTMLVKTAKESIKKLDLINILEIKELQETNQETKTKTKKRHKR